MSPPYRDVIQNALYGRSRDALNLLCEDDAAEGVLQGVFDFLIPWLRIGRESIRIGRDTGAGEFPMHAAAFRKFGQIRNFVFVLDGDKRDSGMERKIAERAGGEVPVFFIPGRDSPEIWMWDRLRNISEGAAGKLPVDPRDLSTLLERTDTVYNSASDRPSEIAKAKLRNLTDIFEWSIQDICRTIAGSEAERKESDIQPLVERLENVLLRWRAA